MLVHSDSRHFHSHFSGIYTIKASSSRFLKSGNSTSMPGQEGVPAVYSPMTRTLDDLEMFWKAVVSMKPWEYDHSVRLLYIQNTAKGTVVLTSYSVRSHPLEGGRLNLREAHSLGSIMGRW